MSILDGIRRHGMLSATRRAFLLAQRKSGYTRWRFRNAPKYANPTQSELDAIERNLVELGISVHDYAPSPAAFRSFQTEAWFPADYHGGIQSGVWDEKLLEHWIASERLGLMDYGPEDVYVDVAAASSPWTQRLRERKHRPHKPFALMMSSMEEIRTHCWVSPAEETLLASSASPIVLLHWRESSTVVRGVAPNNRYLGVMLPYTPLHHLLLRRIGRPLVMTSGNLSEEPIAKDNDEAMRRLGTLADGFLFHDRDIYARYDDSLWFVPLPDHPQPIRRARGYAPHPVRLSFPLDRILACGAELKNTFCLTRDQYAFVSQHIGDMENLETLQHFESTVKLYEQLFRAEPGLIACDLHPDYLATRYAKERAAKDGLPLFEIQHHHAHIASCLADNGWGREDGPVIGVAWDGTGYGADGHIWGGEFLVADYGVFRRAGHLEYLPMPGGEVTRQRRQRI